MAKTYPFTPDYTVAPGATLKETLEARGVSQAELAARTGMAEKTISQIINGVAPITYETAEKLELVLAIPARFWNRRELSYREALARTEANDRLAADVVWLDELPIKTLKERKHIEEAKGQDLVRTALQFFGVSSVDAWRNVWGSPQVQYRGKESFDRKPGHVAAWLRIGELQAAAIETEPFNADEFRRVLSEIRELTVKPSSEWWSALPTMCARVGVAVTYTKEFPGAGVSGAARWLTKDKALIQLSLKFKTNDHIWFSFFHEAAHILLHGKKERFVDYGVDEDTKEEREADAWARNFLIPPAFARQLPRLRNRAQIIAFAEELKIAPGIVVGRLQRDKLAFPSAFYNLKVKIDWK